MYFEPPVMPFIGEKDTLYMYKAYSGTLVWTHCQMLLDQITSVTMRLVHYGSSIVVLHESTYNIVMYNVDHTYSAIHLKFLLRVSVKISTLHYLYNKQYSTVGLPYFTFICNKNSKTLNPEKKLCIH